MSVSFELANPWLATPWRVFILICFPLSIEAVVYGCYVILVGVSTYILIHVPTSCRVSKHLFSVTMVMFVISTGNMALDCARTVITMYLSSNLAADLTSNKGRFAGRLILAVDGLHVTSLLLFTINQAIGNLLLMYRCYILWDSRGIITIAPTLLIVVNTIFSIGSAITDVGPLFVASILCDILLTSLIASRIWWKSRGITRNLSREHSEQYRRIILIVVESGFLYSSFLSIYMVLMAVSAETQNYVEYPAAISKQIVGIVPTLLIVRIHLGKRVDAYIREGHTLSWAVLSGVPPAAHSTATHNNHIGNENESLDAIRAHSGDCEACIGDPGS